MKNLIIFFLILSGIQVSLAQQKYQRARVYVTSPAEIGMLQKSGISLDHFITRKGIYIESIFKAEEIQEIENLGFQTEILIDDMKKFYRERDNQKLKGLNQDCDEKYTTPENYNGGSMGGFLTHDEVLSELDEMRQVYPQLISNKNQIDSFITTGGNKIFYVKISSTPDTQSNKTKILYTALHHSREPQSMQQLIFYMWYLLENYDNDSDIKNLVDNLEMFFVPILNPDGYKYNESTDPYGGGFWRKNRRKNSDGTFGVDLNRNYSYEWGGLGASRVPEDDTYRGPEAFSEPETQAVKWLSEQFDFVVAINAHTFSGLMLFPFAYDVNKPTPDHETFEKISAVMVKENGYINQITSRLYPASGGSDDWLYGDTTTKSKVYAFTPEIGYDFWPPQNDILPTNKKMIYSNLTAARFAVNYAEITEKSDLYTSQLKNIIDYDLTRIGLSGDGNFTVSLVPVTDNIVTVGNNVRHSLDLFDNASGQISYVLDDQIQSGDEIIIELNVDNGLYVQKQKIVKIYGQFEYLVNDPVSNFDFWTSSDWNVTNSTFYSSPSSISDSPNGDYSINENSAIVLKNSFDLSEAVTAIATFYTKYTLERDFDFVRFEVSTNGGNTWIPQCGKYTVMIDNQPSYTGYNDWVKEEIDLSDYLGEENVLVRFLLNSDEFSTYDGFYFDNFEIKVLTNGNVSTTELNPNELEIFPNPTNSKIQISTKLNLLSYKLFDLSGKLLKSATLDNSNNEIDVSHLKKGSYVLNIKTSKGNIIKKLIKN